MVVQKRDTGMFGTMKVFFVFQTPFCFVSSTICLLLFSHPS